MSYELTFPLLPRRRVAGPSFGSMRSLTRGTGLDLAGSRLYRPGDDIRRIDWRASARRSKERGNDEFVVREHLTEEATHVVIAVDRSPSMALYPPELPWLSKPAAIVVAGTMILESAIQTGCVVGYLDDADARHPSAAKRAESPFWHRPSALVEPWRVEERYLPYPGFHAPEDSPARLLGHLTSLERALPPGSFVFLLSDFLVCPDEETWADALDRGLDPVPVVIQDPIWEQSFPDIAGAVMPLADPASGRLVPVRLTRTEVRTQRGENEERLDALFALFEALGLDAVLISSADRGSVLEAFLDWAQGRHQGARLAR